MILRLAAEKNPSAALSSPLTLSRAYQELLLTRRNGTPHSSALQRTSEYASLLRISGALHLGIFEQPDENDFFSSLLEWTPPIALNPSQISVEDILLPILRIEATSLRRKRVPQLINPKSEKLFVCSLFLLGIYRKT